MSYDSRPETYEHIAQVRGLLLACSLTLQHRAHHHDESKLVEPELSVFNEFTPKLRESTYGSEEYEGFRKAMGKGLEHHYEHNDHHPEHFEQGPLHVADCPRTNNPPDDPCVCEGYGGPGGETRDTPEGGRGIHHMDLIQMTEMLCDWLAATMRHADGDIGRSITQNAERFGYGPEIEGLLRNTARRLALPEE